MIYTKKDSLKFDVWAGVVTDSREEFSKNSEGSPTIIEPGNVNYVVGMWDEIPDATLQLNNPHLSAFVCNESKKNGQSLSKGEQDVDEEREDMQQSEDLTLNNFDIEDSVVFTSPYKPPSLRPSCVYDIYLNMDIQSMSDIHISTPELFEIGSTHYYYQLNQASVEILMIHRRDVNNPVTLSCHILPIVLRPHSLDIHAIAKTSNSGITFVAVTITPCKGYELERSTYGIKRIIISSRDNLWPLAELELDIVPRNGWTVWEEKVKDYEKTYEKVQEDFYHNESKLSPLISQDNSDGYIKIWKASEERS